MATERYVNDQFMCGPVSSVLTIHSASGFSTEAANKKRGSLRSNVTDATEC